jgi:hypothetical protein
MMRSDGRLNELNAQKVYKKIERRQIQENKIKYRNCMSNNITDCADK